MAEKQFVTQRINFASNVDKKSRVIYNVSVCTSGEALGHGVWTDEDFIKEVTRQINEAGKIKAMFGHGGPSAETIGNEIGWFSNARSQIDPELTLQLGYDVWRCIADFHATAVTAKNRELLDHIFVLAKKDPAIIGTSIVFMPGNFKTDENGDLYVNNSKGLPHETIKQLLRCDFVSDPANNPRGVFERNKESNKPKDMPIQKTQKRSVIVGLSDMVKDLVTEFRRSNEIQEHKLGNKTNDAKKPYEQKARNNEQTQKTGGKPGMKTGAKPGGKPGVKPGVKTKLVYFTDIDLGPDNGYLQTTTEVPAVGDPVDWVDPAGEIYSPADDGEYTAIDGTIYRVEGGVIAEIISPMSDPGSDTDPGANAEDVNTEQMQRMARELAKAQKEIADLKAAETSGRRNTHLVGPSRFTMTDKIIEGIKMIGEAKRGASSKDTQQRFTIPRGYMPTTNNFGVPLCSAISPKTRSRGTGVDWGKTLEHCARYLPELFFEKVIVESLQKQFNVIPIEEKLGGDAVIEKKIPIVSDSGGASYDYSSARRIKKGIYCGYVDDGETVYSERKIRTAPWHCYRRYCPREWGNFLDANVYVNDEQIPFESVVFELYLSEVIKEWEGLLLNGTGTGDDPFEGIVYQMENDPDIPSSQILTPFVPTAGNAVSLFEQLYLSVPNTMYGRNDMKWFMPMNDESLYRVNYRSTFHSLPYNTSFDKSWVDLAMFRGEFVQSIHMPQGTGRVRQFIMPATDLWIIMSKEPTIESGYLPDEGVIFLKIESHTGVGYPISQNITLAKQ